MFLLDSLWIKLQLVCRLKCHMFCTESFCFSNVRLFTSKWELLTYYMMDRGVNWNNPDICVIHFSKYERPCNGNKFHNQSNLKQKMKYCALHISLPHTFLFLLISNWNVYTCHRFYIVRGKVSVGSDTITLAHHRPPLNNSLTFGNVL